MRIRKILVTLCSATAIGATAYGVYCAVHSPLFLVRVVEVADLVEDAPVDAQTITDLAAVPVGKVSLFDLDLRSIENRIMTEPWVREVRLQKRFPQTLSISVIFREPRALLQTETGALSYVDTDGKVFGRLSLAFKSDLPLISGIARQPEGRVKDALSLLGAWEKSDLGHAAQVASLNWDAERGYRALITYSTQAKPQAAVHTMIDLGSEVDPTIEVQLSRLSRVIHYLSANSIPARQIWADAGKKIVVKTAHGS